VSTTRKRQLAIVAQVTEEVNKLTVQDHTPPPEPTAGKIMGVGPVEPSSPEASVSSKQASNMDAHDDVESKGEQGDAPPNQTGCGLDKAN
jgi:hypothetical protein